MKFNCKIFFFIFLASCKPDPKTFETVTNREDYQVYLTNQDSSRYRAYQDDLSFWIKKLDQDSSQFVFLGKIGNAHTTLFSETGNVEYLINAEKNYQQANQATNYKNAGYLRSLAHNYVSQHRFRESLVLLKKAELIGGDLKQTQKMLFDVYLELGNRDSAAYYLAEIKGINDFDYLIRTSKWNDHEGNLEAAIKYLEKATKIAESSDNKDLKGWCYTNLADYYGHAGVIKKSYEHYLRTLQLNPGNAYAKKGIAWIVYSKERNLEEAHRILDAIMNTHQSPDYLLFKAEIAEFQKDKPQKNKFLGSYLSKITNSQYGEMYNKYLVLLYTDELDKPKEALEIAQREVKNRPTVQSYELLAWSYFKNNELDKAYQIAKSHIYQKTFEPEPLLHLALIAKAAGDLELVNNLKKELEGTYYELGPLAETEIHNL